MYPVLFEKLYPKLEDIIPSTSFDKRWNICGECKQTIMDFNQYIKFNEFSEKGSLLYKLV